MWLPFQVVIMSNAQPNHFYVNRKLLDSERWLSEPFTRGQAWLDMFGLAQHTDSFFRIRGIRVSVKRGQLAYSQLSLAKRWNWSRNKVRRYLKELEKDGDIEQQNNEVTTVITIKNYDLWQGGDTTNETTNETTEGQQKDNRRYTYKKDKNEKNEKNVSTSTCSEKSDAVSNAVPSTEVLPELETDLQELRKLAEKIFKCPKMVTDATRKKYKARRKTFSHKQIMWAFRNLENEHDKWKIKNNGGRTLAWWLHNDDRIEGMASCHMKQSSSRGIIIS